MFAGLPGIGVGTLFYVLIALWMPVRECGLVLNGTSSWARWRAIGVQLGNATAVVASIALAERVMLWLLGAATPGSVSPARLLNDEFSTWLPGSILAAPMTASLLLLGGVLLVVEVLRLVRRPAQTRPEGRGSPVLGEANYPNSVPYGALRLTVSRWSADSAAPAKHRCPSHSEWWFRVRSTGESDAR